MGILLLKEVPYAHVIKDDCASKLCSNCLKVPKTSDGTTMKVRKCTKCNFVHYCNKKCQREDWNDHKWECTFLRNVAPRVPASMVRLMSRIAMKLQSAEDEKPSYNGRTFASLMTHAEQVRETKTGAFCSAIIVMQEYMGNKFPDSESGFGGRLLEIFSKIVVNALEISDDDFTPIGHGLFVGLSALDHSCDSDTYVLFDGKVAVLRALKENVKEYSDNLTIPYCDICMDSECRKEALREQYFFTCTCLFCRDPVRLEKELSLRCIYCADGYCPCTMLHGKGYIASCVTCNNVCAISMEEAAECHAEYEKISWREDKIRKIATVEEKYELAADYAESTLVAFKTYYPRGHPVLALRYYICGCLLVCQKNLLALSRLEEAAELLKDSHGSDHAVTLQAIQRLKALQKDM